MQMEDNSHRPGVFIDNLHDTRGLCMYIDTVLSRPAADDNLNCGLGRSRDLIEMQIRSSDSLECGKNLSLSARACTGDGEVIVRTIQPCFDLRAEEVNCPGGSKP